MQGPYRPQPPGPDPELARLAAEGQQRRMQAAAERNVDHQQAGGKHLRTAIGAYRGSTLKRVMLAGILFSALVGISGVIVTSLGLPEVGGMFIPALVIAFVLFMIWVFVPPYASAAAVQAEQSWSMSLPFPVRGYFDVLADEPRHQAPVFYEIRWQPGTRPPEAQLLHSIVGAVDPGARVSHVDDAGALITSSPISGHTGIRVNRVPVYRNHRFPAAIHALVERVLIAVHRSHPIAEVLLRKR